MIKTKIIKQDIIKREFEPGDLIESNHYIGIFLEYNNNFIKVLILYINDTPVAKNHKLGEQGLFYITEFRLFNDQLIISNK